jgi:putative nucleotidyltransferase with HDIG domain
LRGQGLATGLPFKASKSSAGSKEQTPAQENRVPAASLLLLYHAVEVAVAVALFALFAPNLGGDLEILLALLVLTAGAELLPINIYGSTQITPGFAPVMAIMIIFGPAGAAIAGAFEAVLGVGRHHFNPRRIAHGSALLAISYMGGAFMYGQIAVTNPDSAHWSMIPAAIVASLTAFALNALLVGFEQTLRTGMPLRAFWEKHGWIVPNYLALGVIGLALTAAYLALGLAGVLAFVSPALMMRLSMKQYVDKTKENVGKLELQNDALRTANIEIRRVSEELRVSYDGTLEALVNALDARDQETKGHSIRVSRYMMDIAREVGVKEGTQEWVDMQRGSLLHDVGKIGVSDTILLKPAKLTDEEWTLMRKHPEIGYNMLRQVKFLQGPAEIILAHHERWDGGGYPKGLHEDEILLGARIFTVVDTFDSMTSDRPYRKALTTLEAMNEIMACSGTQFDPMVVEAFLDIYDKWVKDREEMHNEESNLVQLADMREAAA